jgi:type VI secretion system Hcp family effector
MQSKNFKYYLIVLAIILLAFPVIAFNIFQFGGVNETSKNVAYTQYSELSTPIYLKLPEMIGSSIRQGHENEIEVEKYSWGADSNFDPTTGMVSSRPTIEPFILVIPFDPLVSPNLMKLCTSGTILQDAVISVYGADFEGQEVKVLEFTLDNVKVVSFKTTNDPNSGTGPKDEINLAFSKITMVSYVDSKEAVESSYSIEVT